MTKRVLYDTNVLLDVVLLRAPFVDASAAALDLVARRAVEGFVAGHIVTTIAFFVQRGVMGALGPRGVEPVPTAAQRTERRKWPMRHRWAMRE